MTTATHHRNSSHHETNVGSRILTAEENQRFFSLIGPKSVTLATGVVQLFHTEPPNHDEWVLRYVGVVGFIKDFSKRSFFVRMYDICTHQLIWEQELFKGSPLPQLLKPFFISLEAENCVAGLCFAEEREASDYFRAVCEKLNNRRVSREPSLAPLHDTITNKSDVANDLHLKVVPVQGGSYELARRQHVDSVNMPQRSQHKKGRGKNKNSRQNLSKFDIGAPLAGSFQIRSHVGAPDSSTDKQKHQVDILTIPQSQKPVTNNKEVVPSIITKNKDPLPPSRPAPSLPNRTPPRPPPMAPAHSPPPAPPPGPPKDVNAFPRPDTPPTNGWLQDIVTRGAKTLKPVTESSPRTTTLKQQDPQQAPTEDIFGDLREELDKRRTALEGSDNETSDDDDSTDWDE